MAPPELICMQAFWRYDILTVDIRTLFELGWHTLAILAVGLYYMSRREKSVYLLDFACFEPPDSWRLSPEEIVTCLERQNCFTPESLEFMQRLLVRSGCGPRTAWPPSMTRCLQGAPRDNSAEAAREESRVRASACMCTGLLCPPPTLYH